MELRVLSWNIRAGGGSRAPQIVRAVVKTSAAIVVLSEYRNNDAGITIRHKLLQAGYRYQAVTHAMGTANSVLLVSKLPFASELHPAADDVYSANIVTAHFAAFSLVGVYLPHKKKHQLLPYMTDIVSNHSQPYVIAGDYNTGKNYVDQKGNSFMYTDELSALEQAGMTDAFRLVHGEAEEYSWYSHQGNGYRYDHTYVSAALAATVKDCYYIHDYRESGLSDHSAMMLTMG